MKRSTAVVASLAAGLIALLGERAALADAIDVANAVRTGGCPGGHAARRALRRSPELDEAARQIGAGQSLGAAVARGHYRAEESAFIHFSGPYSEARFASLLASEFCARLTDPGFAEAGAFGSDRGVWIVIARAGPQAMAGTPARAQASATATPPRMATPARVAERRPAAPPDSWVAREIVERVNAARAVGQRCGSERFPPVAPLDLAPPLAQVAAEHSEDMAVHHEFDHAGHDGSSPSERVHREGYPARLIGENIAYGAMSAAEAVQGWLASPGHCANIMDPRFTETGVAIARDRHTTSALYFTQVFVER